MDANLQSNDTSNLNSVVGGKIRTNTGRTRRHAPYAKSFSRVHYHQVDNQKINSEKGIIGRVANLIMPSWISNWWNPQQDDEDLSREILQDGESSEYESDLIEPTSNGQPTLLNKPLIFKKTIKHTKAQANVTDQNENMNSVRENNPEQNIFNKQVEIAAKLELSRPSIKKATTDFTVEKIDFGKKHKNIPSNASPLCDESDPNTTKPTFYDSFRRSQHKQTTASKPTFNVSAFISPKSQTTGNSFNDISLNTSNFDFTSARSPFYSGSTTYGGSSSIRESANKRARFSPVSNNVRTTRTHVKAKPLSSTKRNMVTSNTAKRILSTLGKMSAPVRDSRTLPNSSKSRLSFSEMLKANSQKNKIDSNKPPTKTLGYSKLAEMSKNFQSKFESINRFNEKTADASNKTISFPVSTVSSNIKCNTSHTTGLSIFSSKQQPVVPSFPIIAKTPSSSAEHTPPQKTTMKIRREKTTMHYSSNNDNVDVVNTMPEITKTDVGLSVVSLPKFNFSAIKPIINQQVKFSSPSVTPIIKTNQSKIPSQKDSKISFMFSSPDVITSGMPVPSTDWFEFSSPVNLTSSSEPKGNSTPKVAEVIPIEIRKLKNLQPPSDSWECPTCMINNKKEILTCVACSEAKPKSKDDISKPQFGSISSVEKTYLNTKTLNIVKPPEGSWSCSVCMIDNLKDKLSCVACSEPKPSSKSTNTSVVPSSNNGFQTKQLKMKFGQQMEGEWECPTCLINNKKDSGKCCACSELNPNKKNVNNTPVPKVQTKQLKMKFQQDTAGTWECPTCMIDNKTDDIKCVACNESKPGAGNQKFMPFGAPSAGSSEFVFNSSSTSSGFAFPTSNTPSGGFSFKAPESNITSGFSSFNKASSFDFKFGSTETNSASGFAFSTTEKKDATDGFSFKTADKKDTQPLLGLVSKEKETNGPAFGVSTFIDSQVSISNSVLTKSNIVSDQTAMFSFSEPTFSNLTSTLSTGFSFGSGQNTFNMIPKETNSFQTHAVSKKEDTVIKPAFPSIADAAKAGFLQVTEVNNEKPAPATTGFQFGNQSSTTPIFGFAPKSGESIQPENNNSTLFSTPVVAPSFGLPSAIPAPTSNVSFNFGSNSLTTSEAPAFSSKPATQPVFGSTTGSIFGNSNNTSGGATFDFGSAAAAPKPPTFNFGSTGSVPTFETKQTANNQTLAATFQAPNNNDKPNAEFSVGIPPSFNFGSSNNTQSFAANTNYPFDQTSYPSGLFSMGAGQSSGGNLFNIGKSNAGSGAMKRTIKKAVRRAKK